MAQIELIQKENFELIAERIGAILLDELTNQNNLHCTDYDLGVYLERIEPVDKSEDVVVNISLNSIGIDNQTEVSGQESNTYYIDVYTFGSESISTTASTDCRVKLHQVVGWVKYILSSTKYYMLGFDYGVVMGTLVENISFDDNFGKEDTSMYRMARITFNVRALSCYDESKGIDFLGNDTVIKISNTNKGFKLIFND